VDQKPVADNALVLSNHSASRLEFTLALMSGEKFLVPRIENDATAFPHARCQPAKHVAICYWIEIPKALRHDNRNVERSGLWLVVANVRVHIARAASQFACLRDSISIPIDTNH
jgi:hypothetical protein